MALIGSRGGRRVRTLKPRAGSISPHHVPEVVEVHTCGIPFVTPHAFYVLSRGEPPLIDAEQRCSFLQSSRVVSRCSPPDQREEGSAAHSGSFRQLSTWPDPG